MNVVHRIWINVKQPAISILLYVYQEMYINLHKTYIYSSYIISLHEINKAKPTPVQLTAKSGTTDVRRQNKKYMKMKGYFKSFTGVPHISSNCSALCNCSQQFINFYFVLQFVDVLCLRTIHPWSSAINRFDCHLLIGNILLNGLIFIGLKIYACPWKWYQYEQVTFLITKFGSYINAYYVN